MRWTFCLVLICATLGAPPNLRAQEEGESVEPADGGNADDGALPDAAGDATIPNRPGGARTITPGDETLPVFALDHRCPDMHTCLKIQPVHGKACHSSDSLTLEITNTCKRSVALGICMEQADRSWNCGMEAKLGPKQTNKKTFASCHSSGNFRALASSSQEHAKQPCFIPPQDGAMGQNGAMDSGEVVNPVPGGAYLNVCTRVKMCCRALQSLPGADSLGQACDALDALPDTIGVQACGEILQAMRRETAKIAGTPPICR